jgi:CRISPR/Cas system-associated exonuclease Cas4 (RecB family)
VSKTGLPVTNWVYEWRKSAQEPSEWAIEAVAHNLLNDVLSGRRSDGSGRFRPSMIGNDCARAQVFSYLGFEQAEGREDWNQMAETGSWLHYKWQYEGLAAGWLVETEIQVEIPEWNLRGAVDGLCVDDSVFELKTMGKDKYMGKQRNLPVSKWEKPKWDHIRQVHAYMHATETRQASIVYVDRDSNKFREFRVNWDQQLFEEMDAFVKHMQASIRAQQLPPILPSCEAIMESGDVKAFDARDKMRFNFCNYREICQTAVFPKEA